MDLIYWLVRSSSKRCGYGLKEVDKKIYCCENHFIRVHEKLVQYPSNNISIYTENITSGTLCLQQYKRVYHKNVSLHSFRIVIYRIVLETDFRGYQIKNIRLKQV